MANDLFLAFLFRGLAPLVTPGRLHEKRSEISIGCSVNARRDFGVDGREQFDPCLGSFIVTHAVPEGG